MERLQRLTQLWNWLPAFRVVAEEENVRRAAEKMHIAPSALSRSIKLLEDELGVVLFDRVGRNLQLNGRGRELLVAVRHAMRLADQGVANATARQFSGHLNVACDGELLTAMATRALLELRAEMPELTVQLGRLPRDGVNAALLAGSLDIALVGTAVDDPLLLVEPLGLASHGVYARREHPLAERTALLPEELGFPFVAPPAGETDHWPCELRRAIGARVPNLVDALTLVVSTDMLVVMPDALADRHAGLVRRLAVELAAPARQLAVRRLPPEIPPDVCKSFVTAVRRQLQLA